MAKKTEQNAEMEQLQVGVRIRHARVLKGMRMKDLAEKVGYDESMISKVEAGKVMPSLPMLNRIVTALDRDLASIFGLEIDEHKLVQTSRDRRCTARRQGCEL
jgi:transcriptional regulator with XRE-family HTH domain